MADKWHSPVSRVCETCGSRFTVQYQTVRRPGGGRYCTHKCNPRIHELNRSRVALAVGPKRALVDAECVTCGRSFRTRVKNIARGGGRFCSRACNPAHTRRFQPAEKHRRHNLKRNYGLTTGEFEQMRRACRIELVFRPKRDRVVRSRFRLDSATGIEVFRSA